MGLFQLFLPPPFLAIDMETEEESEVQLFQK